MKTTTKRILQVLLFCLLAAMLSLGTAIATSAAEITSGATGATEYTIGTSGSGFTLVQESGKWYIKDSNNLFLKATYDYGRGLSAEWGTVGQATSFTTKINGSESTVSWMPIPRTGESVYITFDGTFGAKSTETYLTLISNGDETERAVKYSKTIEHIGNENEYNYRLHLMVEGKNFKEYIPPESTKKHKVGIIIDATETMTADGMSEDDSDRKKLAWHMTIFLAEQTVQLKNCSTKTLRSKSYLLRALPDNTFPILRYMKPLPKNG